MVAQLKSLQPPSSTVLERHAARVLHPRELDTAGDAPHAIRHQPREDFASFIAAEYFLTGFAHLFDTSTELLAHGLPWLRVRGTAAAVKMALSWLRFEALLEEDGARLHIDPNTQDIGLIFSQLKNLTDAVHLSIPAHVHFYRIFHQWDLRHARLDKSRHDDCQWDDDSGLLINGLKISLGQRVVGVSDDRLLLVVPARSQLHSTVIRRDIAYWDSWVLDSELQLDVFGGVGQLVSVLLSERVRGVIAWRITGEAKPQAFAIPDRGLSPVIATQKQLTSAILPSRYLSRRWIGPWFGPIREKIIYLITEEH